MSRRRKFTQEQLPSGKLTWRRDPESRIPLWEVRFVSREVAVERFHAFDVRRQDQRRRFAEECDQTSEEPYVEFALARIADAILSDQDLEAVKPKSLRLADVTAERVEWLWNGWIPRGKLTIIEGHPGQGKSTLTVDLLARLSQGLALPGQEALPPMTVGFFQGEDGAADTVRPRFDAAGGDATRCRLLCGFSGADGGHEFISLPEGIDGIRRWITEHGLSAVVIDPLTAFLSVGVDSYKDADVRRALYPLALLAEETDCTMLLVRHLTKGARGHAILAGGGSIGFAGIARSILLVAPPCEVAAEDPGLRVVAHSKCNVGPLQPSRAFRLCDSPEHGAASIRWSGEVGVSAGELLTADLDRDTEGDSVTEWLRTVLLDGPVDSREVKKLARSDGMSDRRLHAARRHLNVAHTRTGSGTSHRTLWHLPPTQSATHFTQFTHDTSERVNRVTTEPAEGDPLLASLP
jgi:KaiC/GvpD/RAD55 family RecA-like ATPase